MLPSTFTTSSERDAKMRRTLKAKLEYAKFLQTTLDEMAPTSKGSRTSKSAQDFAEFYTSVKELKVRLRMEYGFLRNPKTRIFRFGYPFFLRKTG